MSRHSMRGGGDTVSVASAKDRRRRTPGQLATMGMRRMSSPIGRHRSTSSRSGRAPGRTNGGSQLRGVHYVVVGSPLSSSPGSSCRCLGQRRRDLAAFGPIASTDGLLTLPDVRAVGGPVSMRALPWCCRGYFLTCRFGEGSGVAEAPRALSQPQPRTADDASRARTRGEGGIRPVVSNDARLLSWNIRVAGRPRGSSTKRNIREAPPSFDNDGHFLESPSHSEDLRYSSSSVPRVRVQ